MSSLHKAVSILGQSASSSQSSHAEAAVSNKYKDNEGNIPNLQFIPKKIGNAGYVPAGQNTVEYNSPSHATLEQQTGEFKQMDTQEYETLRWKNHWDSKREHSYAGNKEIFSPGLNCTYSTLTTECLVHSVKNWHCEPAGHIVSEPNLLEEFTTNCEMGSSLGLERNWTGRLGEQMDHVTVTTSSGANNDNKQHSMITAYEETVGNDSGTDAVSHIGGFKESVTVNTAGYAMSEKDTGRIHNIHFTSQGGDVRRSDERIDIDYCALTSVAPVPGLAPKFTESESLVGNAMKGYYYTLKNIASKSLFPKKRRYKMDLEKDSAASTVGEIGPTVQKLQHCYSDPSVGNNKANNSNDNVNKGNSETVHFTFVEESHHVTQMDEETEVSYTTVKKVQKLQSDGEGSTGGSLVRSGGATNEFVTKCGLTHRQSIDIEGITLDATSDYGFVTEILGRGNSFNPSHGSVTRDSSQDKNRNGLCTIDSPLLKISNSNEAVNMSGDCLQIARPKSELTRNFYKSFGESVESNTSKQSRGSAEGKPKQGKWKRFKEGFGVKRKSNVIQESKGNLSKASSMFNLSLSVNKNTQNEQNSLPQKSLSTVSLSAKSGPRWNLFLKKKSKHKDDILHKSESTDDCKNLKESDIVNSHDTLHMDRLNCAIVEEIKPQRQVSEQEIAEKQQSSESKLLKNASSSSLFDTFYEQDKKMYHGKSKSRNSMLSTAPTTLLPDSCLSYKENETPSADVYGQKKATRTYSWLKRTRLSIDEDKGVKGIVVSSSNRDSKSQDADMKCNNVTAQHGDVDMHHKLDVRDNSISSAEHQMLHDVEFWENDSYDALDEGSAISMKLRSLHFENEQFQEHNATAENKQSTDSSVAANQGILMTGENIDKESKSKLDPHDDDGLFLPLIPPAELSDDEEEFCVSVNESESSSIDAWKPDPADLQMPGEESNVEEYEQSIILDFADEESDNDAVCSWKNVIEELEMKHARFDT